MDLEADHRRQVRTCRANKPSGGSRLLATTFDFLLWYAKDGSVVKYRSLFRNRTRAEEVRAYPYAERRDGSYYRIGDGVNIPADHRVFGAGNTTSQTGTDTSRFRYGYEGKDYGPSGSSRGWTTNRGGLERIGRSGRLLGLGNTLVYRRYASDFPSVRLTSTWDDTVQSTFAVRKQYIVETATKVVERCVQMTTDPGDLVLDPTCGSGTTAYAAEQFGRRWITIDTSRVALAIARARVMGARFPYYLLSDSRDGQAKQAEVERRAASESPTYDDIRQGFVYERVPHITLRAISNNAEIDVIWEDAQEELKPIGEELNRVLGVLWEEWEIPRDAEETWPDEAKSLHSRWWERRIARQKEIDASIAANADYEYLYDKPYEDRGKVRVAGPFTVESISPHRVLGVDENGDIIAESTNGYGSEYDFAKVMLDNLSSSGIQQAHREDRIEFTSITPWPGRLVCADGRYVEGDEEDSIERRAAIFIGPEFGTVSRPDLVEAAREAADSGFDVLIACAFNYEAHTTEFESLGRVPVLKARMNADLHMAEDLKNTGKGNLFVIFGEPDIDIIDADDDQIQVRVNGVDVFHPNTGEVRSDGPEGIACWFIDTDYNEEAFFVRHAYFLGASDPYKSLKTTLRAEIDADAWATLHSDTSRPFAKPDSGRIAVKVINHLGDEVLKVFRVEKD